MLPASAEVRTGPDTSQARSATPGSTDHSAVLLLDPPTRRRTIPRIIPTPDKQQHACDKYCAGASSAGEILPSESSYTNCDPTVNRMVSARKNTTAHPEQPASPLPAV